MDTPLLKMENIRKQFPGVLALDGVSISVMPYSTHALMGENGAGKSTLMKILFGIYKKDGGEIFLDGEPVSFKSPKEALLRGVAMVHQELSQAEKLTVADNIFLGRLPRVSKHLPFTSKSRLIGMTRELFRELSIGINPTAILGTLSVSERQMVEIAKAVSYGARVIVFDEPTSSLSMGEAERLFKIIDMLKKRGCAIIYISHKMDEILRLCDTVTVMRDGRHISTAPASELSTEKIIKLMVGRELGGRFPERDKKLGDTLLVVDGLSLEYFPLKNISFKLRRAEILGIAGLDGSGRTELLESLFGLRKIKSGTLTLNGKTIRNTNPGASIKNGFALITEERRKNGIFAPLSITENTVISSLSRHSKGPILSKARMADSAEECISSLRVKTPSRHTKIRALSGGNQQKVIFGRWLLTEPTVLMLDEPTRGIDVGAKYEIYQLIARLADQGRGVILVSSEMPELIGICDRIIVLSGGEIAGELDAASASQESIMALALKNINGGSQNVK